MARRFLPDHERGRRRAGWILVAVGLPLSAVLVWLTVAAERVNVGTAILIALPAGLAALGLRLALYMPIVLEVDAVNRTYAILRRGVRREAGPLDDLGPLRAVQRTRRIRTKNGHRTYIDYVVNPAVDSEIHLFVMDSPGRARQKMETLARRWQLGCQSLGGDVRAAEDLDKPLHERVRIGPQALAPMPLRPEWGVRLEPLPAGQALVSSHRSWAPLLHGAFALLAVPFVVAVGYNIDLLDKLQELGGDRLAGSLAVLQALLLVPILWRFWLGARDTFFPGAVQVTERGVSYRGRRMRFEQIEEVTSGVPVEVVGDRRILRLARSFCPPEATEAVAYELQRLILESAPRGPLGSPR